MIDQPTEPGSVLVCLDVNVSGPHVPSFVDRCQICATAVWRSQRSRGWTGTVVCTSCALPMMVDQPGPIVPAPYVADDLDTWIDIDPAGSDA